MLREHQFLHGLPSATPSPTLFSDSIFPIGFAHYPARTPTAERCLGYFRLIKTGAKSSRKKTQTVPKAPPKHPNSVPIFSKFSNLLVRKFQQRFNGICFRGYFYIGPFSRGIFNWKRCAARRHIVCCDLCCERTHGGPFYEKLDLISAKPNFCIPHHLAEPA